MKLNHPLIIIIAVAICFSCNNDDFKFHDRSYPSLDTREATDINDNGAVLHGELLGLGTSPIKDYGFVYRETQTLSLNDSEIISLGKSPQTGEFSAVANRNMPEGKLCFYTTYAIVEPNNMVVYGREKVFTSLGGIPHTITDIIPSEGFPSDTFMIIGSGFSNLPYGQSVFLGDRPAKTVKSPGDTIYCIVPKMNAGEFDVAVVLNDKKTISPKKFKVKAL